MRLSVYFILAYLGYLLFSFLMIKYISKFDMILGLVRFMRKSNSSLCCIKVSTIIYLCYFILCPIIIALAWSLYLYAKIDDEDSVIAAAIFLMIIFSTFTILGCIVWYGAKWHVSKAVIIFFVLAGLSAWLFALSVTLTENNYSYSGVSAILLATNFVPACYILQKKTVWKDVPLYGLFRRIAKKMSLKTEADQNRLLDMTPVQRRQQAETELNEHLSKALNEGNRSLRCNLTIAAVLYLISMGTYLGVFLAKEEDDTISGLALLNPLFILCSDIVILSLRE